MIEVKDVYKSFGDDLVLNGISLKVNKGEIVGIAGPNGCGKTTLLRIIAGVEKADSGDVRVNGKVGVVPQENVLLPWFTIGDNIGLGLKFKGLKKEEIESRVSDVAKLLGIEDYLKTYPRRVSGGIARKTSIARALVLNPDILLLDEPYTGLDLKSVSNLQELLRKINEEREVTMLIISHQLAELVNIANRIYVFSHKPARIKAIIDSDIDALKTLSNIL